VGCSATIAGFVLAPRTASAEVTIVKKDNWEAYVAGRVNAFVTYAFGDAYPRDMMPNKIIHGGGVENGVGIQDRDWVAALDANGQPDPTQQGKLSSMRVRSGYIPNVLTLGFRDHLRPDTTFMAQVSIWGTIDPGPNQNANAGTGQFPRAGGRTDILRADFREGFLDAQGPWGSVRAGKFLGLVSRGITEMEFLYGHGYGVGFPAAITTNYVAGSVSQPGPTGGLVGFGVIAATYAPGLTYATPDLAGLKLTMGVFEPVALPETPWNASRLVRPEGELTYDYKGDAFKVHLFGNGGYQKLYVGGTPINTAMWATGYGGRVEIGPVHLGGGGHFGKGVGLTYAFDGSATSSSQHDPDPPQLRSFSGIVAMGQFVAGQFDINLGFGRTAVSKTDQDYATTDSVIKTQTGISGGVVYHLNESFHLDVDFINTSFEWSGGEKQKVNFLNGGVVVTF